MFTLLTNYYGNFFVKRNAIFKKKVNVIFLKIYEKSELSVLKTN